LTETGQLIDNDGRMSKIFNYYFFSVFTKENFDVIPKVEIIYSGSIETIDNVLENRSITRTDVLKVTNKLKPHMSTIPDEIYARVLKKMQERT